MEGDNLSGRDPLSGGLLDEEMGHERTRDVLLDEGLKVTLSFDR